MIFRQRLGLRLPPILLRLALAATFIWSGSGKFWGPVNLTPEQEATLSAIKAGGATAPDPSAESPDPAVDQAAPGEPMALAPGYQLVLVQNTPDAEPGADHDANSQEQPTDDSAASSYHTVDFIALLIHAQATPNEDGKSLLPAFMGQGKWPIRLAYAVGVTELLGGIMLLLGLFTRLWALALFGVMIGALWMTSIGPVVIYSVSGWPSFFPVLPAIDQFSPAAWQSWLFQLNVLTGSLALACLGAGGVSLDRLFFPTHDKKTDRADNEDD